MIQVKFANPRITGTDALSDSIIKHFQFINRFYFDEIYRLIKEISLFTSTDYNNIQSITGIRFQIGEIIYYPKKGNIHLIIPDNLVNEITVIANKYFKYVECEKEYEDDDFATIVIGLA